MVTRALIKFFFEPKTAIEKIVGENYYIEVKPTSDINPSDTLKHCEVVRKGFANLFANDFIKDYFKISFRRRPFFTTSLWDIPNT